MKVTLLGHASVYIEMEGAKCLMDPVFHDPFEDTAVVSCPRRTIDVDAIPPVDLVVISHNHLDHFDIPSLAHIAKRSRNCDVVCPQDTAIIYTLTKLGFTKIHPEKPLTHLKLAQYELVTTRSFVSNVTEFGVVFKDPSGTFWNQVDSVVMPESVPGVLAQAGGTIDLLFAMYASQNFNFFESRGTSFPYDMHALNLTNAMAIKPRMVVPGAAGFRFAGAGMEWCNAFLFPMSRERFVSDVHRIAPDLHTCLANPGDTFEIEGGKVVHHAASSPIAKTLEDDTHLLRFDPTAPTPPLADPNPLGTSSAVLSRSVADCFDAFSGWLRAARASGSDPVVSAYDECPCTYAIGVVFPDGTERWLEIRFQSEGLEIERRDSASGRADVGHRIVASALAAWTKREKTYFYLRAFSRKWSTLYGLASEAGRAKIEVKNPTDLLAHFLEKKAKGADVAFKQWIDIQLQPYVRK